MSAAEQARSRPGKSDKKLCVYTIGHSTRSFAEFLSILGHFGIRLLVDIRSIPRSRHVPQFNKETLAESLERNDIRYLHLQELGGRRRRNKDSVNLGWRNASFQGYADYMQTPAFRAGMEQLLQAAQEGVTAILCAEAVPWRCHRSLVADALLVRGVHVRHILSESSTRPHELTSFAKVKGDAITYPAEPSPGELPFPDHEVS
jgi:uncharacterized protein (DUF488 family)